LVLADIVFIDHTSWLQTLVLSVKEGAVAVNQPAVVNEGLVGRVVVASGPYAKVQLITDRSASVGGMIERTHRQGVVRGVGRGSLELDFVPLQADVRVGDVVLTAGIDGIYPRGIAIGTVVAVAPGSGLFHTIRLRPSVDFGVLDAVYLIEREAVPEKVKEALPDAEP
jgi:rod shape-determining protein MreC